MAGSELWEEAVKKGKISEDEYMVLAGSENNLAKYSTKEILKYCVKARAEFYRDPRFILRLFKKSIKNDDLGFLRSYIHLFLADIKDGLKFLGLPSKNKDYTKK